MPSMQASREPRPSQNSTTRMAAGISNIHGRPPEHLDASQLSAPWPTHGQPAKHGQTSPCDTGCVGKLGGGDGVDGISSPSVQPRLTATVAVPSAVRSAQSLTHCSASQIESPTARSASF